MARFFILISLFSLSLITFLHPEAAAPPIFELKKSGSSVWHNNDSINMNVSDDGSRVRAVLSRKLSLGFVCGFYSIDNISYLFSVIVIGGGNPSVVWSANTDHLVHENATLLLTPQEGLVLRDSDGSQVWSTNTSGKSVAGMNMTALGNLVLFNDKGVIVWQSFDHPTDALLSGQRFYEGQKLISSTSPTNWSQGLYYATLTMDLGLTAFIRDGEGQKPQMYYQMEPNQSSIDQIPLTATGHCRLLRNNQVNSSSRNRDGSNYAELQTGGFLVNLGTTSSQAQQQQQQPLDSVIEYVRLNSDGSLKLYRYDNNRSRSSEIVDIVSQDLGACQYPRLCGEYGLCKAGKCSCPQGDDGIQYFQQSDRGGGGGGCSRITALSCKPPHDQQQDRLIEVINGTYFNVIDPTAAFPKIKNMEECKQACLGNCSCGAAFFRYDNNISDGYCYMPSEVLSIRQDQIPNYGFKSATYIKVEGRPAAPPHRKNLMAIIVGSGSAVFVILFLSILTFWMKSSNKAIIEDDQYYIRQVPGMPVRFSNKELRVATRNFKEKLGGGGFGSVFKGVLQDGTEVAVKRLDKMGHAMREFLAEVETIGSIHHFNLVRLIGFSAEKSSCLLVYEYMINRSLDNWIFYRDQKPCLDWETRKKVIHGIAKGLAYLHEECRQRIIHLDIKPQNILLDENFNAKISDFGLSKLIDRDESQVLTTLRGTPGYIAPECGQSRITVKVDIYSFGIVLLEIVSGRRNLDRSRSESSKHLLSLLQEKAEEDQLLEIVETLDDDEEVRDHREEMVRLIRIAAWCLQNDHTKRPLMSTVVKVLEGVMEVDPNINYKFTHAMGSSSVADHHVSSAPQASVLSNPR
ncbi:unnamed protein product [Camellia sinensis]